MNSHCAFTPSFVVKHSVEDDLVMGNTLADAMANHASSFADVLPGAARLVLELLSLSRFNLIV